MKLSEKFICRSNAYATATKFVNAPYLRREFDGERGGKYTLTVTALGFYELFFNGKKITRGKLCPYISSPNDTVYYDVYDLTDTVADGKNCIGLILGNGMQNSVGGAVWDFDKGSWRGAPCCALCLEKDGDILFEGDDSFRTAPSPWLFDDLRLGEKYDARLERTGWNEVGFDDGAWSPAERAPLPKGERAPTAFPPVAVEREIRPVSIERSKDGYLYDFGYNTAGFFRLHICGTSGQKLYMELGEWKENGALNMTNIRFFGRKYDCQTCEYTCKGGEETFEPSFSYYGYRYIYITGVTEQQATEDLLTMLVGHTDLPTAGGFACSSPILNDIQAAVRNSDLSNFFHFPTDCPHREKNGWTGDASVSCVQMLLNFDCAPSLKEWLRNIRNSQRKSGGIGCVVPSGTWGNIEGYGMARGGCGPVWDSVLTVLVYRIYQFTGDVTVLEENADAIDKYLHYLAQSRKPNGLITYGLGDWVQPDRAAGLPDCPIEVTSTFTAYGTARMARRIFDRLERKESAEFAKTLTAELRAAIYDKLVDRADSSVKGDCETSQALGLYYDLLDDPKEGMRNLLSICKKYGDAFAVGMVGTRILLHVLSDNGSGDLAYRMVTDPDRPSYAYGLKRFPTALTEQMRTYIGSDEKGWASRYYDCELPHRFDRSSDFFLRPWAKIRALFRHLRGMYENPASLNHHFLGDVSHWMIADVAGLSVNPDWDDLYRVDVHPDFLSDLTWAEGWHRMPYGKITVRWERTADDIVVDVILPEKAHGFLYLSHGTARLQTGRYHVSKDGKTILKK